LTLSLSAVDATFGAVDGEHVVYVAEVAEYRPGAFFERELPPIVAVVEGHALDLLVVDGYVTLSASRDGGGPRARRRGRPGAGHGRAAPVARRAQAGRHAQPIEVRRIDPICPPIR